MNRRPSTLVSSAILATSLLLASNAAALDPEVEKRAEALFREGRSFVEAGSIDRACPKFEESYRLDPRGGTLVNLADCYQRAKRWASAKAQYEKIIQTDQKEDRRQGAAGRLAEIAPRVFYVTLEVKATEAGLVISRDGLPVPTSEYRTPVALDPGAHRWEAHAPGHATWSFELEVPNEGGSATVEVPSLTKSPLGAVAPSPGSTEGSTTLRNVAIGAAAAGVIGVGLGSYFGLRAASSWSDAQAACISRRAGACSNRDAVDLSNSARSQATTATVSFIAGGVLLGAGITLFVLSRRPEATRSLSISVGRDVSLNGTF